MVRTLLTLLLSVTLTPALLAQDTVRVQTLTFSDITKRRGTYLFPDSTHSYRKVLMHHTLKCDAATTQDQYACGEWDYLTYNLIHEHTGMMDSTALTHPFFKVGTAAPDSAEQLGQYAADSRLQRTLAGQVLAVNSSNTAVVGGITGVDAGTFTGERSIRSQFIYTTEELTLAGVQVGVPIHQLKFNCLTGTGVARAVVRLGITSSTAPTAFIEDLSTVFEGNAALGDSVILTFGAPYLYDGTGNLVVDLAVDRPTNLVGGTVEATEAASTMGLREAGPDGHVRVGNDVIGMSPVALASLSTAVTITFRVWGDELLPINTTFLEAVGAQGQRILNIHLPWSDSRVYWDAGNDGSAYDRIDKLATAQQLEGRWNDWAFVKNTATGSMKIYLNGALWHSGTGKTKPLTGITAFKLGCDAAGNLPYPGLIDEVNVFAAELSASTLATWKGRRVTPAHPDHGSLLQQFSFDEVGTSHTSTNSVDADDRAWLMGTVQRGIRPTTALSAAPVPTATRPVITLVQGDLEIATDTNPAPGGVVETKLLTIERFAVDGNTTTPLDTLLGYAAGWTYQYDADGQVLDSTYATGSWYYNDTLHYFGVPFDVIKDWEIGRFITPYGIGLTLGSTGFRWTYDVTDYQWLLRDSVDLSAGNQQELIDLEFELIEGIPPRTVVAHQQPWGGLSSRTYADLDNNVALPPAVVSLHPDAAQWSLRTRLTGHGHNSNTGEYPHCCEWKNNSHYLYLNGSLADQWNIWQVNDCALNPVYPQGGTWLNSREGWCPGDLVKDHEVPLFGLTPGGTATLDYDITPVPANNQGMGGGNYVINMDLMEFSAPNHSLDAEIAEVKRPSMADMHRRNNPICYDPLVVLRNAGATQLTSATFTYGVSGGTPETFTWTGSLDHMERTEVVLPISGSGFWVGDDQQRFTVSVGAPNGGTDAYGANDTYHTDFTLPAVYSHVVVLHYKTNNRPNETSMRIRDVSGTIVHSRTNHVANTNYIDTLDLGEGCFTLEVIDTGNDGFSYWADPDAGTGFCRLKKPNGVAVKYFENEFGRSIVWPFTIAFATGLEEVEAPFGVNAHPNPTHGQFTLALDSFTGTGLVEVMDAQGRTVHRARPELYGNDRLALDLSAQAGGIYLVRVSTAERSAMIRVVKD